MQYEIDRLDIYLKYKGLNDNEFTDATGISNGWIGKVRKNKSSLTQKTRQKIIKCFPDLSESWLVTGGGQMLTATALKDVINKFHPRNDFPESENATLSPLEIEQMRQRIKELEGHNSKLTEQLIEVVKRLR